jgi:hypothetical protein
VVVVVGVELLDTIISFLQQFFGRKTIREAGTRKYKKLKNIQIEFLQSICKLGLIRLVAG